MSKAVKSKINRSSRINEAPQETGGWIKLYRKFRSHKFYTHPVISRVFIECLLRASHKEKTIVVGGETVTLKPGEFVLGLREISRFLVVHLTNTSWALNKLVNEHMLERTTYKNFSLCKVVNWEEYQGVEHDVVQIMDTSCTDNEHLLEQTINKEKKKKKKSRIPTTSGGLGGRTPIPEPEEVPIQVAIEVVEAPAPEPVGPQILPDGEIIIADLAPTVLPGSSAGEIAPAPPGIRLSPQEVAQGVQLVLNEFYQVNRAFEFGHKGHRAAAEKLVKAHGIEMAVGAAKAALLANGDRYFGKPIQNPSDLARDWLRVVYFYKKNEQPDKHKKESFSFGE